jgi:phosphatidylglycerophosphatase A
VASLPAAALVWWLAPRDLALLAGAALIAVAGIWAAGRTEDRLGETDPSEIVVHEVAGMLIACAGHPRTVPWVLGAFLVFRAFDIGMPLGIRQLPELPGGLGVVADDMLAGVYRSLLGHLLRLFP